MWLIHYSYNSVCNTANNFRLVLFIFAIFYTFSPIQCLRKYTRAEVIKLRFVNYFVTIVNVLTNKIADVNKSLSYNLI